MRVLLSIKPEYAEKILEGSKKFEYRRRLHKRADVRKVLIYATKPIGKVIGEFDIVGILASCPGSLWTKTASHSGVSQQFYDAYFQDRKVAYAIKVGEVRRFDRARSLSRYLASGVAPQSYAYV